MFSPRVKAYLVHAYTASTVILQLLSMHYLLQDRLELSLFVMSLAVIIDATDGFLARRYRVKDVVPEFDGRRLDDIVDYISYVFLPVAFLIKANMLIEPMVLFGCLPLLASAFGFSRSDAKLDEEGYFVGFPSYWNVLVVYLYLLAWPAWLNTIIIVFLSAMVLVPTRYIYITRYPHHRNLHFAAAFVSGVLLLIALMVGESVRTPLILISLIYPIYYTYLSFRDEIRARRAAV
jgi:phosphatidylcholine synthase